MQRNVVIRRAGIAWCFAVALLCPAPARAAELAPPEYIDTRGDNPVPSPAADPSLTWLSARSTGQVWQAGEENLASIIQQDGSSSAVVRQFGNGNRADILQQGSGHDADITQEGNRNTFSLTQSGFGQHLDVMQWGDDLSVQAAQR